MRGDLDLVVQVRVRLPQRPQQARQILWGQVGGQGRIRDQAGCG
ncbi:MAG TPA: hypothetical protein VFA46_08640 [Actinomycetes bacterium]|nr:hypothetical protein [Actinomycetes bacterium]